MKMIRRRLLLLTALLSLCSLAATSQTLLEKQLSGRRSVVPLREGWRFTREDDPSFATPEYDDSGWQEVRVPHDWAIYGPFSAQNDRQNVAITQDGQKEALEHAGRTGGLPFVGVGWYRYHFSLADAASLADLQLYIDGAMSHSEVFVNGEKVGGRPFGYIAFHIDLTKYLRPGSADQVIAIRLENPTDFSRWYPGAGLFRHVYLVASSGPVRVEDLGVRITTPVISDDLARVRVETQLRGEAGRETRVRSTILDGAQPVATDLRRAEDYPDGLVAQDLYVPTPHRWDLDDPHLYTLVSEVLVGETVVDEVRTPFGIREIELRPEEGFFLNGRKTDFRGVCLHHDQGPLGAAVNVSALRRQIRQMKDMGANAIRTSHNMPAPELVQLCDEMGMMVMVESFDEWRIAKVKNGYHRSFDDWAERDLRVIIRQYRNAPSVVMWCIGNEVYEQGAEGGSKVARALQDIAHDEDPTRPVTQGMDNPTAVTANGFAAVMDVAGFNYRPWHYPEAYKKLPQRLVLGTETASTLSSRGVYKFPVERRSMATYDDHQASSYDVEHCGWSNLPEDDWIMQEDEPYVFGEFIWTGIDYLGEPTPYYTHWPSHSSLFGAVDLAGIPKDRFYLYRSHWNTVSPTLHILPHWTWPGREGEVTPVFVYTSYPSAELFINGKSQGRRTKDLTLTAEGTSDKDLSRLPRYRLMWMDTVYEPGTIRVVAYDEEGRVAAEKEVHTAGAPYALQLIPEVAEEAREGIPADDPDRLVYIRVRVVDRDGNLVVPADHEVTFDVTGAGRYVACANGDPTCIVPFQSKTMPVFSGEMTVIVAPSYDGTAGALTLRATAPGLRSATLTLPVVR